MHPEHSEKLQECTSDGRIVQRPNKCSTVVDGFRSFHTGHSMLFFTCHTETVRLTEDLRGTRKSEPKKRNDRSVCTE